MHVDVDAMAAQLDADVRAVPRFTAEQIRVVRREYSRRLREAAPDDVVALAFGLLALPPLPAEVGWGAGTPFVRRFVAYELIAEHRAALGTLGASELERLGQGIASWEAVDTFALYLAGPVWRAGQVGDDVIHTWARSPDRWWRRAALVSTVPLNSKARGGNGDTRRTLAVCRLLLEDRDDMVVKAMSWALRELAKREPDEVQRFLGDHESVLAPRVLREVRNKLTTGLKNPRRGSPAV